MQERSHFHFDEPVQCADASVLGFQRIRVERTGSGFG